MQPQAQIPAGHVAPHVSYLLLAGTMHFFHVMEILFDRRTLGFTRILFGFLLLTDLFRRTPDWMAMFAATGVLPAPFPLPTMVDLLPAYKG